MSDEPKTPVTYQEVVEAIDAFLAEGRSKGEITGRLIRSKVGDRGSFETLVKHRGKYFAELEKPKAEEFVTEDDLAALRSALNNIVARQIDADRAQADFERDTARAEIRALQARVTDLEDVAAENEGRWKEAQAVADAAQVGQLRLELRAVEAEAALNEARRANEALGGMVERLVKQLENDRAAATGGFGDGQHQGTDAAKVGPAGDLTSAGGVTRSGDDVEETVEDFDDGAIFPMDNVAFDHDAFEGGKETEPD